MAAGARARRGGRVARAALVLVVLAGGAPAAAPAAAAVAAAPGPSSSSAWLAGVLDRDIANVDRAIRTRDPRLVAATESGAFALDTYDNVAWERLSGRRLPLERAPVRWSIRSYSYTAAPRYDFAAADVSGRGGVSIAELVVLQRRAPRGPWLIDYALPFFRGDSLPRFGAPAAIIGCAGWCIRLTEALDRYWSSATATAPPLGDLAAGPYTSQLDRSNAAYIARTSTHQHERITDLFSQSASAVPYVIATGRTWIVVDAADAVLRYASRVAGDAFSQNAARTIWPAYLAPGRYGTVADVSQAQYAVVLHRVAPGSEQVAAMSFDLVATTGTAPPQSGATLPTAGPAG